MHLFLILQIANLFNFMAILFNNQVIKCIIINVILNLQYLQLHILNQIIIFTFIIKWQYIINERPDCRFKYDYFF